MKPIFSLRTQLMGAMMVHLCLAISLTKKPLARMQCRNLCINTGGCISYAARQRDISCHLRFTHRKRRSSKLEFFNDIPKTQSFKCSLYSKIVKPKMKTKQERCVNCMARVSGEQGYCQCLKGWTFYSDSCYQVVKQKTKWGGALRTCRKRGGYLAEISNKKESFFIKSLIKKARSHSASTDRMWVGGTDKKKEGVWRWKHSGERVPRLKWCAGQPDNGNIVQQNCLVVSAKSDMNCNWDLDDDTCFMKYHMVCEAKPICKDPC